MFKELDGLVSVFNDGSVHLSICLVINNYEAVDDLSFPVGKSIRKRTHFCNSTASEINNDLLKLFLCSVISAVIIEIGNIIP